MGQGLSSSILIVCEKSDIHSFAVERCLSLLGEDSHLILPQTLSGTGEINIDYRREKPVFQLGKFTGTADDVKSIYNRRLPDDYSLPEYCLEIDQPYIQRQLKMTLLGILSLLEDAFAVNPLKSVLFTSNKVIQLAVARDVGFRVPDTVIATDPALVSGFIDEVKTVCTKSLESFSWRKGTSLIRALTATVNPETSVDPLSISLNPNIYQAFVDKKCEYRLTVFGNYHAAVRIDNQIDGGVDAVDWRFSNRYLGRLSPAIMPDAVINAARAMLKRLGLRFGTFDLAETSDGEIVFFEVNESGAFLWQEEFCEGVYVLEPFARFLASADDNFHWNQEWCSPSLSLKSIIGDVSQFDGFDPNDPMSPTTSLKYWAVEEREPT